MESNIRERKSGCKQFARIKDFSVSLIRPVLRETRILFRRTLLWLWGISDGTLGAFPSKLEVLLLRNPNTLPGPRKQVSKFLTGWQKADWLWNEGFYRDAVKARVNILEEMYETSGFSANQKPRFYSPSYTSNIGHLGNLFFNYRGFLNEDDSDFPMKIICKQNDLKFPFLSLAFATEDILPLPQNNTWEGLFEFQPLFEQLSTFRAGGTFIDFYDFASSMPSDDSPGFVIFRKNLISSLEKHLSPAARNFFDSAGEFVTLQVRKSHQSFDIRNQDFLTYCPTIKYLDEQGFRSVFLGNEKEERFTPGLSIYSAVGNHWTFIDQVYSLLKSRFLIGTTSGPTYLAHSLNIPVLHTNATSIGRNLLGRNKNSLHIPKQIKRGRSWLNFEEILSSPLAYCESSRNVKLSGAQFIDNTEFDILEGAKLLLQLTSSRSQELREEVTRCNESLLEATHELGGISKGLIAPSFLESYPYWRDFS